MQLNKLLENNRFWSESLNARDPEFFKRLAMQQRPEFLWIGCSDSRVPANEVVGLMPGELFVHRNVGNMVVATDMNLLSVLQYAVDVLQVKHIIVCGHYGCGGVRAAISHQALGLIDNWLRHIQDVRDKHIALIQSTPAEQRVDRLCELNAIEQVVNVAQTTLVRDAWGRGQELTVHGFVYGLSDGMVHDLGMRASNLDELGQNYQIALAGLHAQVR